jgi:hypothetical protein
VSGARTLIAGVLLAVVLTGCATSGGGTGVSAIEPKGGRSGLQVSGTLGGRQLAVNDGAPVLRLGDCDVNDGSDTDLCFFSRELDGGFFALIIENPDVIREDTVAVVESPCRSPHCDQVSDGLLVELQREPGGPRDRATSGHIEFTAVEEGQRYAGELRLAMPDGEFSGTFEIVPRPEEP